MLYEIKDPLGAVRAMTGLPPARRCVLSYRTAIKKITEYGPY